MQHEGILALLALYVIMNMPDRLPESLRQVPAWVYGWVHDTLKSFATRFQK